MINVELEALAGFGDDFLADFLIDKIVVRKGIATHGGEHVGGELSLSGMASVIDRLPRDPVRRPPRVHLVTFYARHLVTFYTPLHGPQVLQSTLLHAPRLT